MRIQAISRLLIALTLMVFVSACREARIKLNMASNSNPAWLIREDMTNIGIIVLDFQTLQLKRAYFNVQTPCSEVRPPVDDAELKSRAGGLFNAVGKYWSRRIVKDENGVREELDFEVSYKGDLAVLEMEPGDFGGFAVSHRCSGLVLYAGSIVWSGTGRQLYPAISIPPNALKRAPSRRAPTPERIDVVSVPYANEDEGIAAWKSIQDLNFVQDMAHGPYSVLVYLYPRSVGVFAPSNADWVIFVHRSPAKNSEPRDVSTSTPTSTQPTLTPTRFVLSSPLSSPLRTPGP